MMGRPARRHEQNAGISAPRPQSQSWRDGDFELSQAVKRHSGSWGKTGEWSRIQNVPGTAGLLTPRQTIQQDSTCFCPDPKLLHEALSMPPWMICNIDFQIAGLSI